MLFEVYVPTIQPCYIVSYVVVNLKLRFYLGNYYQITQRLFPSPAQNLHNLPILLYAPLVYHFAIIFYRHNAESLYCCPITINGSLKAHFTCY